MKTVSTRHLLPKNCKHKEDVANPLCHNMRSHGHWALSVSGTAVASLENFSLQVRPATACLPMQLLTYIGFSVPRNAPKSHTETIWLNFQVQRSLRPINELYPFCQYGRKGLNDVLTGICSSISPYINKLWKAKIYCECQVRQPGMFCSEPVSDEFQTD